jgi:predicted nucleotidyltransferase
MGQVEQKVLDEIVRRVVEVAQPEKIILFGSAAHGRMGPESDIDVMVVMPDGTHCLSTAQDLYKHMGGVGSPVDILVATPEKLEKHKNNIGLVYHTVLAEGKEIYAA